MSFIAGAVALTTPPLDEAWRRGLEEALPPHGGISVSRFDDAAAAILHLDLGSFSGPGFHTQASGAAAVAGEPFLPSRIGSFPARGTAALMDMPLESARPLVARSTGNWTAAVWNSSTRTLRLFADRLASRPLYWWSDGKHAVFASAISVFEKFPGVPKLLDYQGMLEVVRLRYALADRTPYRDVRRLLAGEIITLAPGGVSRERHWKWESVEESTELDALAVDVVEKLRQAVARRLGSKRQAVTFLSGGMDSRVVNQLLVDEGVEIQSFNFSPAGSQDAAFGEAYARRVGIAHHHHRRRPETYTSWARLMAEVLTPAATYAPFREPAWSGDGGSVCAGWVYVEPGIVSVMRRGDSMLAARTHLQAYGNQMGRIATRSQFRNWASGRVEAAMQTELDRFPASLDPARRFFLFLVENDQRTHLDGHFETILEHRQELWTPFLDGDFLTSVLSVPADAGMGHRFYDRWFRTLAPPVWSVPWQTYPGHVPCPVPIPEDLSYQWTKGSQSRPSPPAELLRWLRMLVHGNFPAAAFSRPMVLGKLVLHALRIREGRGWLDQVATLHSYWDRAGHHDSPF